MNIKRFLKIISNIIVYILIIVLLFFSATVVIANVKGKQPEILGYKFYTVLSGSMEPTIETGDLIIVEEVSPDDINVGDIISFKSANTNNIVTHRVFAVVNEDEVKFKTKGDANNVEDNSLVDAKDLQGRYVRKLHSFGYVVNYIEHNIIRIFITLIIVIIACVVITKVIKELIKNKKNN